MLEIVQRVHNLYFEKKKSGYEVFYDDFISPKIRRDMASFRRNIDCLTGFRTQGNRNFTSTIAQPSKIERKFANIGILITYWE